MSSPDPPAPDRPPAPRFSTQSVAAFSAATASLALAFAGGFLSPMLARYLIARDLAGLNVLLTAGTYVLPLILGLAGAGWGRGMGEIERSGGRLMGDGFCVFAIMIGLLAAVLAGVIIFARLVWGSPL